MKIKTNVEQRKQVAKCIGEYVHEKPVYQGPPTFSYQIGPFNLDRSGIVHCEGNEEGAKLRRYLIEQGYVEPDIDTLDIRVPIGDMNGIGLTNLVFEIKSKAYLLNRILRKNHFKIEDHIVEILQEKKPEEISEFLELIEQNHETISGLKIEEAEVVFSFPINEDPNKNRAYIELAAMIVSHAREAKRISPEENKPENEKYYLRVWLVRLGLDGKGAKETRKALLEGLKGHTAFRTAEDEAKHKARLLQRKAGDSNAK